MRHSGFVKHLGQIIRQLREDLGWKQEDLAREAGVRLMTVSKVENDQTNWTRDTITRIATGLGLSLAQLFVLLREAQIRRTLRKVTGEEITLLELWARVRDPVARRDFLTQIEGTSRGATERTEGEPEADDPPAAAATGDSRDAPPRRRDNTPGKRRL